MRSLLRFTTSNRNSRPAGKVRPRQLGSRLGLECLEDRTAPAAGFTFNQVPADMAPQAAAQQAPAQQNTDANFLSQAWASNLLGMYLGGLTLGRSNNSDIRSFVTNLLGDDRSALQSLAPMLRQAGLSLPGSLGGTGMQIFQQLSGLRGAAFDRTLAQAEVTLGQQLVTLFGQEAQSGVSSDIRSFAQAQLSGLQQSLSAAGQLRQNLAVQQADAGFLRQAWASNMLEMYLGGLALVRSNNPSVRAFAADILSDHAQALRGLAPIMRQAGLPLLVPLSGTGLQTFQRLSSLSGAAFDRAFAQTNVTLHQQAIALFSQEAQSGANPAAKTYAQANLPTLQQHLSAAVQLQQSVA